MTLISLRNKLYKPIDSKTMYYSSDYESRLVYSWHEFYKILNHAGLTKKTIERYDSAIEDFILFLALIDTDLNEVYESDFELYRELLLRRNNNRNKRAIKTKITRVRIFLSLYYKINASLEGDWSISGYCKRVRQIEEEQKEELERLTNTANELEEKLKKYENEGVFIE